MKLKWYDQMDKFKLTVDFLHFPDYRYFQMSPYARKIRTVTCTNGTIRKMVVCKVGLENLMDSIMVRIFLFYLKKK